MDMCLAFRAPFDFGRVCHFVSRSTFGRVCCFVFRSTLDVCALSDSASIFQLLFPDSSVTTASGILARGHFASLGCSASKPAFPARRRSIIESAMARMVIDGSMEDCFAACSIENAISDPERIRLFRTESLIFDRRGNPIGNGDWAFVVPRVTTSGVEVPSQVIQIDYFHGVNGDGHVMCQTTPDEDDFPSHMLVRFSYDSWLYKQMHRVYRHLRTLLRSGSPCSQ